MDCLTKQPINRVIYVQDDPPEYGTPLLDANGRFVFNDDEVFTEPHSVSHVLIEPKHRMVYVIR